MCLLLFPSRQGWRTFAPLYRFDLYVWFASATGRSVGVADKLVPNEDLDLVGSTPQQRPLNRYLLETIATKEPESPKLHSAMVRESWSPFLTADNVRSYNTLYFNRVNTRLDSSVTTRGPTSRLDVEVDYSQSRRQLLDDGPSSFKAHGLKSKALVQGSRVHER